MNKILIVGVMSLLLGACSDAATAKRHLESQGFTDVVTDGYAFFACSKDDAFATSFKAKSVAGKQVSGAVCSGWLKGATIRFY